jgi:hypothetical protein
VSEETSPMRKYRRSGTSVVSSTAAGASRSRGEASTLAGSG